MESADHQEHGKDDNGHREKRADERHIPGMMSMPAGMRGCAHMRPMVEDLPRHDWVGDGGEDRSRRPWVRSLRTMSVECNQQPNPTLVPGRRRAVRATRDESGDRLGEGTLDDDRRNTAKQIPARSSAPDQTTAGTRAV